MTGYVHGYGTPEHHAGLRLRGSSPHHRQSFVSVRQLSLDFSTPETCAPLGMQLERPIDRETRVDADVEAVEEESHPILLEPNEFIEPDAGPAPAPAQDFPFTDRSSP